MQLPPTVPTVTDGQPVRARFFNRIDSNAATRFNRPALLVSKTEDFSLSTGALGEVPWDVVLFDNDGWAFGVNNTEFVCQTPGLYLLGCYLTIAPIGSDDQVIEGFIRVMPDSPTLALGFTTSDATSYNRCIQGQHMVRLVKGDKIRVLLRHRSASTQKIANGAPEMRNRFWAVRISD